ncbi:hypothetical protein CK203_072665 [Vitis vinifera]|uniref:Integrase catalytic domain-containing protein n=1 Tax=Vitis vinifera TaxID=29760 RepID=A0A438EYY2_VITVI|nr:hypothetical protein CK203_072665 [Vitis vinifera]
MGEYITEYLWTGTLPEDPKQAHKVRACSHSTYAVRDIEADLRPWPFAQWGMDIVGPLPAAPAQKKFLLVVTDYFSKWVEAEAYASIKEKDVTKFNSYSTPCYPQSNGQAEATNKTLITALKKKLEQAKGKWVEKLPGVLWLPTIRTEATQQDDANAELGRNLDCADEVRESAAIRMADYQQRASAHYNRK